MDYGVNQVGGETVNGRHTWDRDIITSNVDRIGGIWTTESVGERFLVLETLEAHKSLVSC